ncbi:MAG: SEC-C domain-containing protein [Chloroflexi bacterium]|nr:SEC-C domain-containing protein [Chloroflexota bacterium]
MAICPLCMPTLKAAPKPNDPCPCGRGKPYKDCCGKGK